MDGEIGDGPFLAENKIPFETRDGRKGYAVLCSLLSIVPSVVVVPRNTDNEFGQVDTERSEMLLCGTKYQLGAVAMGGRLLFHFVGTLKLATAYLDQPEELESVENAQFLPLVRVEHRVYASQIPGAVDAAESHPCPQLDSIKGVVLVLCRDSQLYRRVGVMECEADSLECILGEVDTVRLI